MLSSRPLFSSRLHHVAAAAALAALHIGAAAQTATPGQLQTITVTAERRVENIREVPSSVSALQGEVLDVLNTSGQDVRMLSGRVPSLNIESSFGRAFPRFYIRGYGNTDFRLNASQPVSLVYDDVVQENPILKGFPVFDMARVEVLRGPQGTLFGRNTPAGVVKFESVKPGAKGEGYGSASWGTYNTLNVEGAANLPLGPGMAVRLSVLNQTRDDWVRNTVAAGPTQNLEGYRDSAMRTQFLFEPSKDLSVLANLHARNYSGSARLFRANIIQPGTSNLVPGFDPAQISIDGANKSVLQNYGANLRIRAGLGGGLTLHSVTGYESVRTYSRGDIDGGYGNVFAPRMGPGVIPFSSETADGIPRHSQFTQELRLESDASAALSWQAGVFLFSEDYKVESFTYDSGNAGAQIGYERVKQKNDALAVFGAVNYAVTPAFKLRGGLRYTHDKKTFNVEDYNSSDFVPCVLSGKCTLAQLGAAGPLTASPSDNKLSWDASATFALDKDTNVYARVATGFRGSSVQGAGAFNDQSVAKPENNTSVEAGVKADLFNKRARLAFNVFAYQVKDLQLTAVGGGANANILLNAQKASGRGFELDFQSFLTDQMIATLGLGYNHTKIQDAGLIVSACGNGQSAAVPPRPNCGITNRNFYDAASGSQKAYIDGNPLPQAPKLTASFTLRYSQPVGAGEVYALTDWVYRSKVNFFLYEATEFTGPALTEGGLRVGWQFGNGKYDLAVYGRNITNQIRVVGGIDFNNLTGFINDPRTFGVQFKATF
jgi:iron complex outermembrane receptor protein